MDVGGLGRYNQNEASLSSVIHNVAFPLHYFEVCTVNSRSNMSLIYLNIYQPCSESVYIHVSSYAQLLNKGSILRRVTMPDMRKYCAQRKEGDPELPSWPSRW